VNDAFGHKAGDALLARFAEFLRRHIREDDCVARVGGEEFLLVLRDIPRSALDRAIEDLRVGVHGLAGGAGNPCSASFGAVHVTACTSSADDLVAAADELMYRSKEAGRDRAIVADLADVSLRARSAM
jgi:diguanylate cyclase (GGDEF)-like protein